MLNDIEHNIIKEFDLNPNKYFKKEEIYFLYKKIKSGNYNITDIYNCIIVLNFNLYIGNKIAITKDVFGKILRENRKSLNITRLNLMTEHGISFTITNKVESGKNCRKYNLLRYLNAFPNLKIILKKNIK